MSLLYLKFFIAIYLLFRLVHFRLLYTHFVRSNQISARREYPHQAHFLEIGILFAIIITAITMTIIFIFFIDTAP